VDRRGEEDELVAEPALLARRHHLAPDRGQQAENRPDHVADDDHRQREREADHPEDLERARPVGARERDLGEIRPPEARRGVDQHHRPRGESDRDHDRPDAEALDDAEPQERHERQHRRRHEHDDVRGDDLLHERLLRDQSREHEPDRRADREPDQELLHRHPEVMAVVDPEVGGKRLHHRNRPRDHVLRLVRPAQDALEAPEDGGSDAEDRADL
jgi:hypothetical protein